GSLVDDSGDRAIDDDAGCSADDPGAGVVRDEAVVAEHLNPSARLGGRENVAAVHERLEVQLAEHRVIAGRRDQYADRNYPRLVSDIEGDLRMSIREDVGV